jgi:hypothetical protein
MYNLPPFNGLKRKIHVNTSSWMPVKIAKIKIMKIKITKYFNSEIINSEK